MRRTFACCCRLTSVCLRYAVAIGLVWLRDPTCNLVGLNEFGFDYPLHSDRYSFEHLRMADVFRWCLASRALSASPRRYFRSPHLAYVCGCSLNEVFSSPRPWLTNSCFNRHGCAEAQYGVAR